MNQPIAYVYKQSPSRASGADHFLMAQAWFFCPSSSSMRSRPTLVLDPAALWGLLAGAFIFTGFFYFVRSLAVGSVSINAAIFRLNFIVTVVLVVALFAFGTSNFFHTVGL